MPPKSTGREDFGEDVYLRDALGARKDQPYEDLVATAASAAADSIIQAFERFILPNHEVSHIIVGGGGTNNRGLMKRLKKGFGDVPLYGSEQFGIPSQAREAIAFAILGNETLCGTPSNVPQATGANKKVVLGDITLP